MSREELLKRVNEHRIRNGTLPLRNWADLKLLTLIVDENGLVRLDFPGGVYPEVTSEKV